MTQKKKLSDVFKTVGLPPYTYIKPSYYGEIRADIEQPGRHLLIEGPSGIGKTCVVYKVFEELSWQQDRDYKIVSGRDSTIHETVESFLNMTSHINRSNPNILVIDDFHILSNERRADIGSHLKRLSDKAFEISNPPKVILIGIPTAGVSLLSQAYDLGPRLGTYRFNRASDHEISKLLDEGESALNVIFEDENVLLSESEGNFWLAQYICNKVCASQDVHATQDDVKILSFDLLSIRRRLMAELSQKFMSTAKIFCKGKKWRPGGNKPYLEVFVALKQIPDSVITFDKVLNIVPERRKPGIRAIRSSIPEVIFDSQKNTDLRKQITFEAESGYFSIEDPLFRYFLSNLDVQDIYRELGVELDSIEKSKVYTYDVGFSFAGEVRSIVELINKELKLEEVITFYDADQQGFLLAMDLEPTLEAMYSQSCRFYLVFLDKLYKNKVWTRYERDIMTRPSRSNHIIPVILDDEGSSGTVGISSTLTRIDLREVWNRFIELKSFTEDDKNIIRNRCILPLVERIGAIDTTL